MLNHANGETYISFNQLQHNNCAIKRVVEQYNCNLCEFATKTLAVCMGPLEKHCNELRVISQCQKCHEYVL